MESPKHTDTPTTRTEVKQTDNLISISRKPSDQSMLSFLTPLEDSTQSKQVLKKLLANDNLTGVGVSAILTPAEMNTLQSILKKQQNVVLQLKLDTEFDFMLGLSRLQLAQDIRVPNLVTKLNTLTPDNVPGIVTNWQSILKVGEFFYNQINYDIHCLNTNQINR